MEVCSHLPPGRREHLAKLGDGGGVRPGRPLMQDVDLRLGRSCARPERRRHQAASRPVPEASAHAFLPEFLRPGLRRMMQLRADRRGVNDTRPCIRRALQPGRADTARGPRDAAGGAWPLRHRPDQTQYDRPPDAHGGNIWVPYLKQFLEAG